MSTLNELISTYNTLASSSGLPIRKYFKNKTRVMEAIEKLSNTSTNSSVNKEIQSAESAEALQELAIMSRKILKLSRKMMRLSRRSFSRKFA